MTNRVFYILTVLLHLWICCRSQSSTTITDTSTTGSILPDTTTSSEATTGTIPTTASPESIKTTDNSQSQTTPQGIEETSSTETPTEPATSTEKGSSSTAITTTTITIKPLMRLFFCDFSSNSCFEDGEIRITNGTELISMGLNEPPRAPLSDVSSINEPTTNNETCKIPYQLPTGGTDNSTNTTIWDMWFCYENQCPTESAELSNCTSGNYGLITIESSESNKTISSSISPSTMIRDSAEEQCLLYYYYFTVYDQLDWGQQISVSIRSDNETDNETVIDRLSVAEMIDNRWHGRNVTFNSPSSNYILIFYFEVSNANRTEDSALNKTIYFALDNIEVYNRNCDDLIDPITSTTTIPPPATTQGNVSATVAPSTPSNNLGLILGLSLGLGIPALIIIVGGLLYNFKKIKLRKSNIYDVDNADMPMKPTGIISDSEEDVIRHIF